MVMAMEIEYDSDLSDVEAVELSEEIRPYMFEPLANNGNENASESETDSDHDHDEYGGPGTDPSEWCECDNCEKMETELECQCCRATSAINYRVEEKEDMNCITEHPGFEGNCLNIDVLEASYYEFIENEGFPQEGQLIHETYRYIAYRRFARWIWRRLPKNVRKVLPSCVVTKIREQFPSEDYCGFKYPVWN